MTVGTLEATIAHLPLDTLYPHPDNPRLQLREDVIERLSAEIAANGFGPEHALLVRPIDGGHQVISGHHRLEAARRAGLESAPAWVKDLGDEEAFMLLILSNTQGELSKLERAVHVFRFGERGGRGRGKKGDGLKAYAERIDRPQPRVSEDFAVGELVEKYRTSDTFADLAQRDLYSHLLEISKAAESAWPTLVDRLLAKSWTVSETKSAVDKIRQFEIPGNHADWLPLDTVIAAYLKNDRFNPATVTRLIKAVEAIDALIDDEGTDEDAGRFLDWLTAGIGGDAWDHRKISDYHATLIREIADRREAEAEAAIVIPDGINLRHGDFREILNDLRPGSVDAIVTDPPYPAEFLPLFGIREGHEETDGLNDFREEGLAEVADRILKPGGICAVMVGQSYLPEIIERMTGRKGLTYHWTIAYLTPGGQAVQVWQRKVNTFWKPVLIFVKGEYAGDWLGDVAESKVNDNDKNHHHWGQSESGMADLLGRLTKPGQLVVDPFLGGGTTAVVCHQMSRKFIGCDIDETAVKTTIGRFAPEAGE